MSSLYETVGAVELFRAWRPRHSIWFSFRISESLGKVDDGAQAWVYSALSPAPQEGKRSEPECPLALACAQHAKKTHRILGRSTVSPAGVLGSSALEAKEGERGQAPPGLFRGEMEGENATDPLELQALPPPNPGVRSIRGVDNHSPGTCLLNKKRLSILSFAEEK